MKSLNRIDVLSLGLLELNLLSGPKEGMSLSHPPGKPALFSRYRLSPANELPIRKVTYLAIEVWRKTFKASRARDSMLRSSPGQIE